MKVDSVSLTKKFNKSVAVQTNGGQPTDPMWASRVSDADLATAISDSLSSTGLFSSVVTIGQADYVLNATLVKIDQPMMGFTMSVGVEIVWSVVPKAQKKTVWERLVSTRQEKTVGDAFAGVTRLRMATEAAVKENIRQALMQLSEAPLPE